MAWRDKAVIVSQSRSGWGESDNAPLSAGRTSFICEVAGLLEGCMKRQCTKAPVEHALDRGLHAKAGGAAWLTPDSGA